MRGSPGLDRSLSCARLHEGEQGVEHAVDASRRRRLLCTRNHAVSRRRDVRSDVRRLSLAISAPLPCVPPSSLDDNLRLTAKEVGEVGPNGHLAHELVAVRRRRAIPCTVFASAEIGRERSVRERLVRQGCGPRHRRGSFGVGRRDLAAAAHHDPLARARPGRGRHRVARVARPAPLTPPAPSPAPASAGPRGRAPARSPRPRARDRR